MATTINSMSVNLGMDAKGFIDTAKISRTEARALAKDIEAARNPLERMTIEQDRLTKALEAGAISEQVYNRILEEKRNKLLGAVEATDRLADADSGLLSSMSQLGNVVSGVRNGLDMIGAGVDFVMDKWRAFDEIAERLDTTKDRAEKLGLTFSELGSLEFATRRLGGDAAAGALDSAMGKMLKTGFVQAGESATEAFKRAADEINSMANQTERAQRAAEIFGKSGIELLAVLQAGSGEIQDLASYWEQTNGLTQAQLEMIGEYNDRWEDVALVADGVKNIFVVELAPALTMMGESLLGMEGSLSGVRDLARDTVDYIVGSAGIIKDLGVKNLASQLPGGAILSSFVGNDDSATKWLTELEKKRSAIESEALDKKFRVEQQRRQAQAEEQKKLDESVADNYSDLIDGNADKWNRFIEQRADAEERMISKALESAKSKLEKESIEAKRMSEQAIKGPSSADVGTSEYAKVFAENANRMLAQGSDKSHITQQQILEEARKQLQANELAETARQKQMDDLIQAVKSNGFRRIG